MKKILMAVASAVLACDIGFAAVGCGGADGDITVVNRTAGSGTRDAFLEIIGITDEELTPDAAEAQETQNVITTVSGNEKAIGYISLGSLNDTVKAVNVGGHAPTAEAISGGDYAIARPFNVVYEKDSTNAILNDFLAFIFSAEGQTIVEDNGYVKVEENGEAFASTLTEGGSIRVSGSTSVAPLMSELAPAYEEAVKEQKDLDVTVTVEQGGSSVGISDVRGGKSVLGMVSRELTEDEKSEFGNSAIARDGIAIIVNKQNPCTNLTVEQIKNIYTGEVKNWSDVGVTFEE